LTTLKTVATTFHKMEKDLIVIPRLGTMAKVESHLGQYTADKDMDTFCRSLEATFKVKRKASAPDQHLLDAPIKEDSDDE